MTDAEKAVIEAAEAFYERSEPRDEFVTGPLRRQLFYSLEKLRESRKPKPKWQAYEFGIIGPGATYIMVDGGTDEAASQRVLDLLNKADPA